jgi:hypothetical protein
MGDPMPVFTIKAKDNLAPAAMRYYRLLCRERGLADQAREVDKALAEIEAWRVRNPELTQLPDHEHVPVAVPVDPEEKP